MAAPTNTVTTFSVIGNREDLANIIYDISPMDTPFLSQAAKSRASAVYHEWQTDALEAAGANRKIEGDDATANTFVATTRVGNYCQISAKTISVSGTQRAVNSAGRADEFSYQLAKRGREIKRDMEFALTRNQASSAGGTGTARSLASLESWLATNKTSVGTGTAQTTPGFSSGTVVAPTDSTVQGTFTRASLNDVIQKCWTEGGDPKIIMTGPFNKTVASSFSNIATLYKNVSPGQQGEILAGADLYVSDFGQHQIVPNRFQRDRTVLVLDMEYLGVATLRDMETTPLAKTGDSDRTQLLTEFTLVVKNEKASGKVTDCTTS
jgi:hypothetical protein